MLTGNCINIAMPTGSILTWDLCRQRTAQLEQKHVNMELPKRDQKKYSDCEPPGQLIAG